MDIAFSRYANPMLLFNQMIRTGRLTEFVNELIKIRNEENENQTLWELWLHKVYDKTYANFLNEVHPQKDTGEKLSDDVVKATINESMGIINGFCLQ